MKTTSYFLLLVAGFLFMQSATCQDSQSLQIKSWVTLADRSSLFQEQKDSIFFTSKEHGWGEPIVVDDRQQFQSIDGFGFALTGGSAGLMMKMSAEARSKLIHELFSRDGDHIGVSYLRVSIGSSDMNSFVFSYDDLPAGQTDFPLKKFSLAQDLNDVVPVLKEILAIDPHIKLLGSPWSAPAWMKTNNNVRGGALKKECYDVYARYLVNYIQAMKQQGIPIDAITVQNEPLNSRNTPSMQWYASEEGTFIRENLGPVLRKAGLTTKVILFDHNCDRPDYPLSLLNDPEVAQYVDGSGFHLYGGDISAMSDVHLARPDKNLYFTEQMVVEKPGSQTIDICSQVKRLIIGATRNWSRNVLLWNLAADPNNDPHTDNGGCSMCQGAITINGNDVSRNIAFYTVAHASKFVVPGSVRIASTAPGDRSVNLTEDEERQGIFRMAILEHTPVLPNVAFKTPDGKIILIVANDTYNIHAFRIQYRGMFASVKLAPGSVGTYVW